MRVARYFTFSVLISATLLMSPLTFASVCENQYSQDERECRAAALWNYSSSWFSKPDNLSWSGTFRFVYHEIAHFGWKQQDLLDWTFKLLRDPDLIADNPQISASLISNKKPRTFASHIGLLLSFSPQSVIATSPNDLGSRSASKDRVSLNAELKIKSQQEEWRILSPNQLLEATRQSPDRMRRWADYNEVLFSGTDHLSGRKVLPVGIMIGCKGSSLAAVNSMEKDDFFSFIDRCFQGYNSDLIPLLWDLRKRYPIIVFDLW